MARDCACPIFYPASDGRCGVCAGEWPQPKAKQPEVKEQLIMSDERITDEMKREIEKLREALRPFADEARRWSHYHNLSDKYSFCGTSLSRGDLRRAMTIYDALTNGNN